MNQGNQFMPQHPERLCLGRLIFSWSRMLSSIRTSGWPGNEKTQSNSRPSNSARITASNMTATNVSHGLKTSGLSTQIISALSSCLPWPWSLAYPQGDYGHDAVTVHTLSRNPGDLYTPMQIQQPTWEERVHIYFMALVVSWDTQSEKYQGT